MFSQQFLIKKTKKKNPQKLGIMAHVFTHFNWESETGKLPQISQGYLRRPYLKLKKKLKRNKQINENQNNKQDNRKS